MATFTTSKSVGQAFGIIVNTNTGYWKFATDNFSSPVIPSGITYDLNIISGMFDMMYNIDILACDSNGNIPNDEQLGTSGKSDITKISIVNAELTSFDVYGLIGLQELDLSFNTLSTLLNQQSLVSLTKLNLANNQFTEFYSINSLEELYLQANQINNLSISGCTNLTKLNIADNQLTSFNIDGLSNLIELDISGNSLGMLVNDEVINNLANFGQSNGLFISSGNRTLSSKGNYEVLSNSNWSIQAVDTVSGQLEIISGLRFVTAKTVGQGIWLSNGAALSLNSSASFSVMAPPSSSASTIVTARR